MSDNLLDEMYKILSSAMVDLCIAASLVVGAERAVQHVTHMSSRWLHWKKNCLEADSFVFSFCLELFSPADKACEN